MNRRLAQIADRCGGVLFLLGFGFLFPFVWPQRRITLFGLLACLISFHATVFVAAMAVKRLGIIAGLLILAALNALTVLGWILFCFQVIPFLISSEA